MVITDALPTLTSEIVDTRSTGGWQLLASKTGTLTFPADTISDVFVESISWDTSCAVFFGSAVRASCITRYTNSSIIRVISKITYRTRIMIELVALSALSEVWT